MASALMTTTTMEAASTLPMETARMMGFGKVTLTTLILIVTLNYTNPNPYNPNPKYYHPNPNPYNPNPYNPHRELELSYQRCCCEEDERDRGRRR